MRNLAILFCLLFLCVSCTRKKSPDSISNNLLWTFDVAEEYPVKDICLQDIAEVEYIPLETNDSILWFGREICFMDEDYIIGASGERGVYFHDRTGKALHTFHKKGSGPGEYHFFSDLQYDKESNEIYLINANKDRKYFVYDNKGNFKRSFDSNDFRFKKIGDELIFKDVAEFFILNDKELVQYQYWQHYYTRVSRQTGEQLGDIKLPSKDSTLQLAYRRDTDGMLFSMAVSHSTKDKEGYIITSFPSDTTYLLTKDLQLKPIGVRIPSVSTMEVPVFLLPARSTTRYYFMYTVKKEERFPTELYMLDKKENQIYHLKNYFTNRDFEGKKHSLDLYRPGSTGFFPPDIIVESLRAEMLCIAYQEGKLSGKLKDIAANLKEDDNPVLMVVKFKE